MESDDAPPAETVTCTFVISAANQPLFAEERAHLPGAGDIVSHGGHTYRVLVASLQTDAASGAREEAAHSSAVVRLEPSDEGPHDLTAHP